MITIDPPRTASTFALSTTGLARFLDRVRAAVGVDGQIDVLLADDTALRRLNRTWRGKNKPTDVLSFPAAGDNVPGGQSMAGDLAISLDTASRQAAEHGHSLRDEVRILLLHGTLHLAGYDHEADSGEMAEREAELRTQLRLRSGLIARSEGSRSAIKAQTGTRQRSPARAASTPSSRQPAKNQAPPPAVRKRAR